ncbi:uncharacterized protein LOC141651044 [Silene latifolia]|uniref:uncharacterized protein LOC141651044 n=1 Tax=Silene latifolia TaxID=37657 RepID=UPI003D772799
MVREWGEAIMENASEKECVSLLTGCWAIWEARNKMIFEGRRVCVSEVLCRVRDLVEEMEESGSHKEGGSALEDCRLEERWTRPEQGSCKVNVDAGLCGQGVGLGAVCRDAEGGVLWGVAVQQQEEREPQILEAEAILLGLAEARRHGVTKVVLESDCLNVIRDLKSRSTGRSDIFQIYDDIHDLCSYFESVKFLFVRRKFNSVAHELAHVRPWQLGRRIWYEVLSQNIAEFVSFDLVNIR